MKYRYPYRYQREDRFLMQHGKFDIWIEKDESGIWIIDGALKELCAPAYKEYKTFIRVAKVKAEKASDPKVALDAFIRGYKACGLWDPSISPNAKM